MKTHTTLLLFGCAGVLGAFIWFFERHADNTDVSREKAREIFRLDPERVDAIRFIRGDLDVTCVAADDSWEIVDPVVARADAGEMDRVLWGLKELDRADIITRRQQRAEKLDAAQFGLLNPRAQVILGSGEGQRIFMIGRDTPVGGNVYVKEAGVDEILITSSRLLSLVPEKLETLRDRRVFDGGTYDVTKVEIQRTGGFLQLARDEASVWTIQQPYVARADVSAVRRLLDALLEVRISTFVADHVSDPAAYGLEEAAPRITLWRERERAEQSLRLGSVVEDTPGQIYAKQTEYKSVFAVSNGVMDAINVHADDLRDRRLLTLKPDRVSYIEMTQGELSLTLARDEEGPWRLTRPVAHAAEPERVEALLDAWTGARIDAFREPVDTNLTATAGAADFLRIRFARSKAAGPAGDDADAKPETVLEDLALVAVNRAREGVIEVAIDGEDWIYDVTDERLIDVSLSPLYYRDRSVLRLDKTEVRTVTVISGEQEQRIERDENGSFIPVLDEAVDVDEDAVEDLLGLVTQLRAERFVEEDAGDLAVFGLESPSLVLTLGLTGASGIEKSVLIGGAATEGGVYAVIRGEDVVFVLDEAYAGLFRRALYAPAPLPDE